MNLVENIRNYLSNEVETIESNKLIIILFLTLYTPVIGVLIRFFIWLVQH